MRKVMNAGLELARIKYGLLASDASYGPNGAFNIGYKGARLRIVASDQMGWDHVSVSLADRCPTWEEMCYVKDLFWDPAETVVQFHPKASAYIDCHPNCLHMWRRQDREHELPPETMVGPRDFKFNPRQGGRYEAL